MATLLVGWIDPAVRSLISIGWLFLLIGAIFTGVNWWLLRQGRRGPRP